MFQSYTIFFSSGNFIFLSYLIFAYHRTDFKYLVNPRFCIRDEKYKFHVIWLLKNLKKQFEHAEPQR
jgi:hypothetical protein